MIQTETIKAKRHLLPPGHPHVKIHRTYDEHATLAFNITFKEICDLENPRKLMSQSGSMAASAIAYWFLTLDTFLNAHLLICCASNKLTFNKYLNLSITQKVLSLVEILEIDKS